MPTHDTQAWNSVRCLAATLLDVLTCQDPCPEPPSGQLVLDKGRHSISIVLDPAPAYVYSAIVPDGVWHCGSAGEYNWVSTQVTSTGFDINAHVVSTMAQVLWRLP